MRRASDEFDGHCLALTLLGSYLTDAYKGDIRSRGEVLGHLGDDVRQGVHARKVMKSYESWFGEGPELALLRMLGLFDRPADEKALGALLKSSVIPGLTEALTGLSVRQWQQTILAKLRRARLLAGEDPHNRGDLDTHPLVREYFGEQLRNERKAAWRECNRRLYHYYRTVAPELPENFREMEPLFLAVILAAMVCIAYCCMTFTSRGFSVEMRRSRLTCPRARETVLSALVHFFADGRWEGPVETGVGDHRLCPEDQLFILMQAGAYLAATRSAHAPEARICNERAEALCRSLNRLQMLYVALIGQWRQHLVSLKLREAMQIATRMSSRT